MWCVGVFAYELLAGKAPFYHLSRQETFKRIGEAAPTYPTFFSKEAVDFIGQMLRKVPEERMSASDALEHPFLTQLGSK
jgi:serine/threonine protein kinase